MGPAFLNSKSFENLSFNKKKKEVGIFVHLKLSHSIRFCRFASITWRLKITNCSFTIEI
jgi:hypothetical protein